MQTMTRLLFRGGFRHLYSGYSLNLPNPGDVTIDFYDGRKIKILPNGRTEWVRSEVDPK